MICFNLTFRFNFAYYDATKCRWKTETDTCEYYVTNADDIDSNTEISTSETSTDETITTVSTEAPFYQNLVCEPLDDSWMCSSGSIIHFASNSVHKVWIDQLIESRVFISKDFDH